MRALVLSACVLVVAAAGAAASGEPAAKHRRTVLVISKDPAEPLTAYPRTRVTVAPEAATLAARICGEGSAAVPGCFALVSRMTDFMERIDRGAEAAPAGAGGD